MSKPSKLKSKLALPKKSGVFTPSFWLGSEQSAVNINRFWLYLGGIAFALCAICLVRTIEIFGKH